MRSTLVTTILVSVCLNLHEAQAAGSVRFNEGFPVTDSKQIYPLSEIRRGDKGIGYTVLAEDRITSFQVEILGVLENLLGPGKHIILSRLSGKEIEFTGVISGMSGSPVYIDGRLVGAVAYRFGLFSREPIAGITPIQEMIDIFKQPGPIATSDRRGHTSIGIEVEQFRDRSGLAPLTLPHNTKMVGPFDPKPIETPIAFSGFHPEIASEFRTTLKEAGFVGTAMGSGKLTGVEKNLPGMAGTVKAAPIAPGAPISALLVKGDLSVAAIGTVTLVEGKRVIGFGHPFLGYGNVQFPMATSAIINTLATPAGSYKQGVAAREVGVITHDRMSAIGGRLGGEAPMIPLRVLVQRWNQTIDRAEETNVEVVDTPVWFPVLVRNVIATATLRRLGYEAGGTVDMDVRITVGTRTIELRDTYSAAPPMRIPVFVAQDVGTTLSLMMRSDLGVPDIRAVEVQLKVKPTVAIARLEEVIPDRAVVAAGERLGLTARLRPYHGDPVFVRLSLPIPASAEGDVEIYVGGGIEVDRRDGEVYGERFPNNLDELLDLLVERREARALHARVYLPQPGLRSEADLLFALPPSQRMTLSDRAGGLVREMTESVGPSTKVGFSDVVIGGLSVPITVVR